MVDKSATLALGDWSAYFQIFKKQQNYRSLQIFLNEEIQQKHNILPKKSHWFRAFQLCSFQNTKVVILGQDPYPNPAYANGLCFSVPKAVKALPGSLKNIFQAIHNDLGFLPTNGDLSRWAVQGVLLLNAILTVQVGKPASHQHHGWEDFSDFIIRTLGAEKQNIVFLLWGRFARNKAHLLDKNKHLILTTAHPSPLSARYGFLDCKHFSKTNAYLEQHQQTPINWQ